MPIYEYQCTECGERLEVIQKFSARPLRTCRVCKGKLEKLISRTAFILKGGGWYAEGYNRGRSGASKPKTSSSESTATTSGSSKTTQTKSTST
jgi:putative FmdB family regulatory protein